MLSEAPAIPSHSQTVQRSAQQDVICNAATPTTFKQCTNLCMFPVIGILLQMSHNECMESAQPSPLATNHNQKLSINEFQAEQRLAGVASG